MKMPAALLSVKVLALIVSCAVSALAQTDAKVNASNSSNHPASNSNAPVAAPALSRATSEIIRLAQSGIDESVLFSFIEISGAFNLAADNIIYLNELGVSPQVVNAMLAHDLKAMTRRFELSQASQTSNTNTSLPTSQPQTLPALPNVQLVAVGVLTNQNSGTGLTRDLPHQPTSISVDNPQPSTRRPKLRYPVREPYPVEITAPIVFLEPPTF